MAPAHAHRSHHHLRPAAALLFLSPDTIATTCGLSQEDLALLAGLPPDIADQDPGHPRLQSLLRDLFELFVLAKERHPDEPGTAFWSAHRSVRSLGGRTLVEAVADGDWQAVTAHLEAAPELR